MLVDYWWRHQKVDSGFQRWKTATSDGLLWHIYIHGNSLFLQGTVFSWIFPTWKTACECVIRSSFKFHSKVFGKFSLADQLQPIVAHDIAKAIRLDSAPMRTNLVQCLGDMQSYHRVAIGSVIMECPTDHFFEWCKNGHLCLRVLQPSWGFVTKICCCTLFLPKGKSRKVPTNQKAPAKLFIPLTKLCVFQM